MTLLAISGSLRAASSNTRVVEALAVLAPERVGIWRGLGDLPHFNPDLEPDLPPAVAELRRRVGEAEGLIICSPEYAHGVAGSLKNALDWLVPSVEFPGTPAALINAAPHAHHAQAALRETLLVMSARIVEAACVSVPMPGRTEDAAAIAADPGLSAPLKQCLAAMAAVSRERP